MRRVLLSLAMVFLVAGFALADTVILKDGNSYKGACGIQTVDFADLQGVKYEFPVRDVQSLAFSSTNDTVTLRGGKSYTGHFTGIVPINFQDSEGIQYQFPSSDVDAIVFNHAGALAAVPANSLVIPIGADFAVRTNETIDSKTSYDGQTYSASIAEDVLGISGQVAIPAGSSAQLIVKKISGGGMMHSPEVVLDLYSVTVGGRSYLVVTSDVAESNKKGVGANARTAETVGGGTALGALMGGIFGGGKGAGIGALAGAGGGLVTQVFTRGKQVQVPVESLLRFRLEKTLVLRPQ